MVKIKQFINVKNLMIFATAVVLVLSVLSSGLFVRAQEQTGGSGLSISPTRTELSLLPGAADEVVVSLRNITSGTINAKVFINDFEPDNETGEPRLVTDPERKNAASISSFLSEIQDVTLLAGETKDVKIRVSIPANAAPGGYYGALRFQAVPEVNQQGTVGDSEVSLTANVLSLVLIEVPGDITEKVAVNSVKTYLDANSGSIFTTQPNFIGVEIENLGNSFIKPFGAVTVTRTGGGEVFKYEINDSNPRSNVLPNSKRVFKDRLENIEKRTLNGKEVENRTSAITTPGRYTVLANISYGNGGEIFTVSTSFWYIPVWLIITMGVLLLVVVVLSRYLWKKYVTKSIRRR